MIRIDKILCPVDFFPASDAAVKYAAGLAVGYDAKIHLLHVVTPLLPATCEYVLDAIASIKKLEQAAQEEINALAARTKAAGVRCDTEIRVGDVYDELENTIKTEKPDLVVMGTYGRRGPERWFMGSTTEKLLRHTPVPLLTIKADGKKTGDMRSFRRILVTTDFSAGTPDALAYAFSLAQQSDAEITLLHVVQDVTADISDNYPETLIKAVDKQLRDLIPPEAKGWCDAKTRVETGLPYPTILRILEGEKIDLLVMNIHGKGMLDRVLLGSTAERVVRTASCPVMLIPPMKNLARRKQPGRNRVA